MEMRCTAWGPCPRCGYHNQVGVQRCVRCGAPLLVPAGCTGACSRCLLLSLNPEQPRKEKQ